MSRKKKLNPFAPDLSMEERRERAIGTIVYLRRKIDKVEWKETITITRLIYFDDRMVHVYAVAGKSLSKFDPHRESGSYRNFLMLEMEKIK